MTDAAGHAALVYTPLGRDAEIAASLLSDAGLATTQVSDFETFCGHLGEDICFCVLTEEALRNEDVTLLVRKLDEQPPWSDLQFIVLTRQGGGPEKNPAAWRLAELLRNVSFLERPFHPTTFVSMARTAARGRNRQFEARASIEALKEGEERLKTALSAGNLGAWELDFGSEELTATASCKAIFGYGGEEAFNYRDLLARVHPDDQERMKAAVAQSIETGRDYVIEYRTLWRDGSEHWAAINARVVPEPGGVGRKMVGVSADITARKTAESQLQQANSELESRVVERTADLKRTHDAMISEMQQRERAETQLRQSQKMEIVGQLTGGVAHDFNNLLMAIIGNLDLLKKTVTDVRSARYLEGAWKGAQRGAALTQRLLAFARQQELTLRPSNLTELVSGMSDLLDRSLGHEIHRELILPDDLPMALVDVNQLELALLNLAVNARDAMPNGGALRIEADAAAAEPAGDLAPGDYVRLIVTDTGHGMSAETLKKATEPFFSTKEIGKGTGLGLSMIHGLAVQLKGALRLSSVEGEGTRAEIWLPVAVDAYEINTDPLDDRRSAPPRTDATILAVDDDALIAMSTVDMLEDLGFKVIEANSGKTALEYLRSHPQIDLMITDFSMPVMNGAQLSQAAREIRPGLPILLATGYADLPAGFELDLPRLGKPYGQIQLATEIEKLLTRA